MMSEPIAVTLQVVRVLDQLGIAYFIGGSLASALYGEPRATADADTVNLPFTNYRTITASPILTYRSPFPNSF